MKEPRFRSHLLLLLFFICIAFFGESDDSDWEIEAALRPPALNKNNDDIDDFYDWYFPGDIF